MDTSVNESQKVELAKGCVIKGCVICPNKKGYWYCPECQKDVAPCRVVNNETCSDCGSVLEYKEFNLEED